MIKIANKFNTYLCTKWGCVLQMPALDPSSIQVMDYLHVKGVRLVEPGMPQWKIKPLQEKNLQLISEYLVRAESGIVYYYCLPISVLFWRFQDSSSNRFKYSYKKLKSTVQALGSSYSLLRHHLV